MADLFIFDMDGVIINSEPLHMEVELELRNELGFFLPEERTHDFVGKSSVNMWQELRDEFGFQPSAESVAQEGRVRFAEKLKKAPSVEPIPGVSELLDAIGEFGMPKVLASSASRFTINVIMDRFGFHHHFEHLISGAELPRSKPDPMIFQKACDLMKVSPKRALVIEDSKNGIQAANDAGCFAIGFRDEGHNHQDLTQADLVVDRMADLLVEEDGIPLFGRILS